MLLERPRVYLKALDNQNEAPGLLWEAPASQEIRGTFAARAHDALENTKKSTNLAAMKG